VTCQRAGSGSSTSSEFIASCLAILPRARCGARWLVLPCPAFVWRSELSTRAHLHSSSSPRSRNGHQFFVDTKANPPRSIWVHPYDDEEYIKSIPDSHPSQQGQQSRLPEQSTHHEMSNTLSASEIRERREAQDNRTKQATEEEQADRGFGEKLKDKLTGSTKKERDQKKRQRIQQERVSTIIS